jgi:uncharacterized protein (TIGR00290 family)
LKVAILFSGNASSVYCHHLIREAGVDVGCLVAPKAPYGSRNDQSPDLDLARVTARSLEAHLVEFEADEMGDATLTEVLAGLDIGGICDGAVASNRRRNRLVRVCEALKIELFLPLWHKDPAIILSDMIEVGFEIMIVPKDDRLDKSWRGRVLDRENQAEFIQNCDEKGMDPMSESGGFETIVLAGPNMRERLEVSAFVLEDQSP